jgi:hypothetical protein
MKQNLNDFDIKIIIALIIFMLIKSIYNIYILNNYEVDNLTQDRDIYLFYKKYPSFNIISLLTALLYLFSATYFYITDKIKSKLFAAFCIYMVWRAIGYFGTISRVDMPGLDLAAENLYVYYNLEVTSIITMLFTLYLIRLIFTG